MAGRQALFAGDTVIRGERHMARELRRILFVDDDIDIQLVTRFALEEIAGFDVQIARSGPEALAKFMGFNPDLILLDLMMPGMDGFATLGALRELPGGADVPIVFVTAATEMANRNNGMENGAIGVIAKPFDPLSLPGRLNRLWRQSAG